ncbi:integration host factor, actinobacterial type [Candidatus Formimonas warabiya]|uniref:Integration host factor n=1 Tax=Formimonas warabiya TaxID=1761012 RepID=A0A3G1KQS8_FORW1|nr:integration host factor, actinobacterial type [Candidatus Formimonas warabiya]ATW24829.1 integration host factor [Candidatus Formimonas warabiya]
MAVPQLTVDERSNALLKAQEMRSKRMELRKKLKSGEIKLTELLNDLDNEVVARMRVKYLLESLPQVGKITAKKIMEDIGIDESRRIQGLGHRQKSFLLEKLA